MLAGGVLEAAGVSGPPLTVLPVDLTQRRLLSEPNLPLPSREGVGPLRAREEARLTLGSAEDQSPPKRKNSSG